MTLDCHKLDPAQDLHLDAWTFPAYRHLLDLQPSVRRIGGDRRPVQPLAFVAYDGKQPQGLVMGCVPAAANGPVPDMPNDPELLSVFVAPAARHQGVGAQLVQALEDAIAASQFPRITAVYMTGNAEISFLEKLLKRRAWSPPEARMHVLKCSLEQARTMPWYGKYKLGKGFELFPWAELSSEAMDRLKASHRATDWIAADLKPWEYDTQMLEPSASLGIRFMDEIVGWVISHRISNDTVRFTCAFIRRDLARQGRILPAFSEACERARQAGFTRMMFATPAHHPEMSRFTERWCAPWASSWTETRGVSKTFAVF
jgi:GNAT superfamily N-acetyltransferase